MGRVPGLVCRCEVCSQANSMKISVRSLLMCSGFWAGVLYAAPGTELRRASTSVTNQTTPEFRTNALLSIENVLRDVLSDNPSLKAARANWQAMKQRVPQARAWEDLRAGFDTVAGRFVSIPANSFNDQKLMVEQPVPLSGRNRLRGEAAQAEAAAAFGEFRRRRLDLLA